MQPSHWDAISCLVQCRPFHVVIVTDTGEDTGESGEEAGEEENDPTADDSPDAVCITHSQAAEAVDLLMRYFEQSDIATPKDIQPLSAIKRRVDYMPYSAQKQTTCVFRRLEKISIFYDPQISRPPTFRSRFCRKFCDLYASIYGTSSFNDILPTVQTSTTS